MNKTFIASVILIAFVLMAGFGLFLPVSHAGHDMGCPFAPATTALCDAAFGHIKRWQDAFVTPIVEALLLVGVALVVVKFIGLFLKSDPRYERYRLRIRIPTRPILFQELYSQGILNRKAP
jgi:hypothetical protein